MIDFILFDKALKITWVKRLCSDDNRPWKLIPLSLLSKLGGKLLFLCNYNIKYLPINEHLPNNNNNNNNNNNFINVSKL